MHQQGNPGQIGHVKHGAWSICDLTKSNKSSVRYVDVFLPHKKAGLHNKRIVLVHAESQTFIFWNQNALCFPSPSVLCERWFISDTSPYKPGLQSRATSRLLWRRPMAAARQPEKWQAPAGPINLGLVHPSTAVCSDMTAPAVCLWKSLDGFSVPADTRGTKRLARHPMAPRTLPRPPPDPTLRGRAESQVATFKGAMHNGCWSRALGLN